MPYRDQRLSCVLNAAARRLNRGWETCGGFSRHVKLGQLVASSARSDILAACGCHPGTHSGHAGATNRLSSRGSQRRDAPIRPGTLRACPSFDAARNQRLEDSVNAVLRGSRQE